MPKSFHYEIRIRILPISLCSQSCPVLEVESLRTFFYAKALSPYQTQHPIYKRERMGGVAGDVEVNGVVLEEGAIDGGAIGKESTADGVGAYQNNNFGMRHGIITNLEGFSHVVGDGSCDDDAVGMAGRSHKFDTETADVELHIVGSVEFPFATVVAACRNLSEF